MNPSIFFDNFSLLADSPNGIQKLREMILQLAVMGKLVPQDSNDEPASVLLEELEAENKVTEIKELLPVSIEEYPFEIPLTWEWVRFSQITDLKIGRTPKTNVSEYWDEDGFPWVSIADMINRGEITETTKHISQKAVEEVFKSRFVPAGTILMSFKLTIGKISILKVDAFHNEAIISIFPPCNELKNYLFKVLPVVAIGGDTNNAIKGKTLNRTSLSNMLIPLPPLEEQKRIVAKVDQLMTLCDELESLHQHRNESRVHLNNAAINKLLDAGSVNEFNELWQLMYNNFDLLYDNLDNVAKLRQAILQLAVMGKLVPQDSNDEPASVLLKRIKEEKERLVKEGKIRKFVPLSLISEDTTAFKLPANWKWTRIGSISRIIEYGTSHKASANDLGIPVLRMNNIEQGKISYDNIKYVPDSITDIPRLFLKHDDILFNRTNSFELVGKSGIYKGNDDTYTFASYLIRISLFTDYTNPDFFNIAINSDYFRKTQIEPEVTQQCGQANFNGTKLQYSLIPLPPLEEQKRIVAKVDQLMTLCDELEMRIKKSHVDGEKLTNALLSNLTAM